MPGESDAQRLVTDKSGELRTIPDPSTLTTAQLDRTVEGLREVLNARLNAIEQAATGRLERFDRVPSEIREQVGHLQALHSERFASVGLQFAERDIRTEQASKAAKEALDAALLAAKELVTAQNVANAAAAAKSEDNFTKLLDQTATLIRNQGEAADARLTEIKERIDRGAGGIEGVRDARGERRADASQVIAVVGALLFVVSIVVSVVLALVLR